MFEALQGDKHPLQNSVQKRSHFVREPTVLNGIAGNTVSRQINAKYYFYERRCCPVDEPHIDLSQLKEIPSFKPGRDYRGYFISESGDIYSTHYKKGHGIKKLVPRKLKNGYFQVFLNGFPEYVHRLVAITYIPNPENKREVNHKDLNKDNYHVSNLEWATPSENVLHAKHNCKNKSKTSSNAGTLYLKTKAIGHFNSLQQAKKYCINTYNCTLCTLGKCNANWRQDLVFIRDEETDFDIEKFWQQRKEDVERLKKEQDCRNKVQKGVPGFLYIDTVLIGRVPSINAAEAEYNIFFRKQDDLIYTAKQEKYIFVSQQCVNL